MFSTETAIERVIYSFDETINIENEAYRIVKYLYTNSWELIKQYYDELLIAVSIGGLALLVILLILKRQSPEEKYRRHLSACMEELKILLENTNSHPLLLRLAWADAVNYDKTIDIWPLCGGVNGSIRFISELEEPSNHGLSSAIDLLLPLKKRFYRISWADLIQMAGAVAVEECGGPILDLWYGREDIPFDLRDFSNRELKQYGRQIAKDRLIPTTVQEIRNRMLPQPLPPYPLGEQGADVHLRIFQNRLGFTTHEMVALCGAHTIGRAFKERSGVCPFSMGDQGATKYTKLGSPAKGDKNFDVGMTGGCSWTANWLQFDNSYFRRPLDDPHNPELLWLPTDQALFEYPEYRYIALQYAEDQELFFIHYIAAHLKMSELGSKFKYNIKLHRITTNEKKD